jgi:hypothetical protein
VVGLLVIVHGDLLFIDRSSFRRYRDGQW